MRALRLQARPCRRRRRTSSLRSLKPPCLGAGVQSTLHRISAMRNRKGTIVGLTCRVGRAVTGHIDMIRDLLDGARARSLTCRPLGAF
jgi:hypothetical protein